MQVQTLLYEVQARFLIQWEGLLRGVVEVFDNLQTIEVTGSISNYRLQFITRERERETS